MNISNLTPGQQQALLTSLENQVSPKTSAEAKVMSDLRDALSEELIGSAAGFKRCGQYVKMINMDTFGDRYNNNWIKIYENSKGEYFTSSYCGGKRIFI